jgi:ribosomal protein S18 acetylase RimI-like enzyme
MEQHADPWLSSILGRPVFRVDAQSGGAPADLSDPCFSYSKISVSDVKASRALSGAGFFVADTNMSYEWRGAGGDHNPHVSDAAPEDEAGVRDVARTAFTLTRFHTDPNIDNVHADQIKEDWAGNFFAGKRGEVMLVYKQDGKVLGFNQVIVQDDLAIIDLIAVHSDARGRGVARAMIAALQTRYERIKVGTQIVNAPSIGLYTAMGFEFSGASYVFHYHGM